MKSLHSLLNSPEVLARLRPRLNGLQSGGGASRSSLLSLEVQPLVKPNTSWQMEAAPVQKASQPDTSELSLPVPSRPRSLSGLDVDVAMLAPARLRYTRAVTRSLGSRCGLRRTAAGKEATSSGAK